MKAAELVDRAAAEGPWHMEPDGRIRNDRGLDPFAAVLGRWMRRPGDSYELVAVMEAADLPNSRHRSQLLQRLGLK